MVSRIRRVQGLGGRGEHAEAPLGVLLWNKLFRLWLDSLGIAFLWFLHESNEQALTSRNKVWSGG